MKRKCVKSNSPPHAIPCLSLGSCPPTPTASHTHIHTQTANHARPPFHELSIKVSVCAHRHRIFFVRSFPPQTIHSHNNKTTTYAVIFVPSAPSVRTHAHTRTHAGAHCTLVGAARRRRAAASFSGAPRARGEVSMLTIRVCVRVCTFLHAHESESECTATGETHSHSLTHAHQHACARIVFTR